MTSTVVVISDEVAMRIAVDAVREVRDENRALAALRGPGRPSRGTVKSCAVKLSADELRALERLQVSRRETASEVLRAGLALLAATAPATR